MTTRVLLLDDSDGTRLTLAALLEAEGFEVTEVSCLADARRSLEAAPAFDLALLDRHLGDGQGVDLIPVVRARLPRCRIIMISGSDRHHDGIVDNADASFRKGEDIDELFEQIRTLLAPP
jgi:two-component system OmpR family response regulator